MRIYSSYPAITEADLKAFEQRLDITLPDDYRAFLLKYNGGFIEPDTFRYIEDGREELNSINRFFSIADDTDRYSLFGNWHRERTDWQPRFPARTLPIGDNGVGDYICISVSGEDRGNIYIMLHEVPWDNEENLYFIAETFSAFLASLFEYNEDEED